MVHEVPDNAGEQVPEFYANTVQLEATAYDIGMAFGLLSGGTERRSLVVRMSPQHAKSLEILLSRFLLMYEREVGPVQLPAPLISRLRGDDADDSPEP